MKRKIILAAAALAFIGLVFSRIPKHNTGQIKKNGGSQKITVKAENPRIGRLDVKLSFAGDVRGSDQAIIYSEAAGRLVDNIMNEGDRVEKDQVVALIDREVTGMNYEKLKVKTPIGGIINRIYKEKGDSISPQSPIALVANLESVKIGFNVPEKDFNSMKKGLYAEARVDAYSEDVFRGRVNRLSISLDEVSRTAYCEVIIKNQSMMLRPGMFAEVDVIVLTKDKAILIPEEAKIKDIAGEGYHVFLLEDTKAVLRTVEVGYRQGTEVEIVSGLEPGDRVIVEGQHFLKNSEEVREVGK
ncbi:MAG: efflux RND transporter periplasmic adaptor subunit [Elusimicrobiota bacterium]